jgi:hypothetical protein
MTFRPSSVSPGRTYSCRFYPADSAAQLVFE